MKTNIHPKYFDAKIVCSCGSTFSVGSTKEEIRVEICSSCHPFYTGQARLVDTEGRVQKWMRQTQTAADAKEKSLAKKKSKTTSQTEAKQPRTLREMLSEIKESK